MKVLILLIISLLVIGILLCLNSKFRVDNFSMDYSCEAIQNKYYHPEELLTKANCPNLVIIEKHINGRPAFFSEFGDHTGPYFSSDYVRYYYMGMSPEGLPLNLEYDLYYRPWWNPRSWFYGRNIYYPRRTYHWEDDWHRPWKSYKRRIERGRNRDWNYDKYHNKNTTKNRKSKSSIVSKPNSPKRGKTVGGGGASARL